MTRLLLAALLVPLPALAQGAAASPDSWAPRTAAEVIVLDKLRAQPTTVTLKVGQAVNFGTLSLTLRRCVARPPGVEQNSAAFLDVADSRGSARPFHSWLFSNTPAVTQFQHPVYALRLVACQ